MFNSPWTVIFIMSLLFSTTVYVINDIAWPWRHGWSLLRQRVAEAHQVHQRDVRDHQNVTVLISSFFFYRRYQKYWFTRRIPFYRFLPQPIEIPKSLRRLCYFFLWRAGREGAPSSRDPGDDQLCEYDDDSSDNDSDDFAVEEDGAIRDMQNEELGFLFASRIKWQQLGSLCFRPNFSKCNGMQGPRSIFAIGGGG